MFKNYFKTALRNLTKGKLYSIINITGLSVGMAVAMLIALWIYDEVSFDRQAPHYDRIARVVQNVTNNNEVETWKRTPFPLADVLRSDYGNNFKRVVRALEDDELITLGHKKISEHGGYFEPGAPELFGVRMVRGSLNGLEVIPGSIFLRSRWRRLFSAMRTRWARTLQIDTTCG